MIWCFRCSIEKGIVSRIDILGDYEREEKCTKSVYNLFFGTNLSYKGLFQGSTEFFLIESIRLTRKNGVFRTNSYQMPRTNFWTKTNRRVKREAKWEHLTLINTLPI